MTTVKVTATSDKAKTKQVSFKNYVFLVNDYLQARQAFKTFNGKELHRIMELRESELSRITMQLIQIIKECEL